jgi:hypothetical protein
MSDSSANQPVTDEVVTLAALIREAAPMGDLSELAIDDLTPEEEDAFFAILEQA